jgi:hypothetical protein
MEFCVTADSNKEKIMNNLIKVILGVVVIIALGVVYYLNVYLASPFF